MRDSNVTWRLIESVKRLSLYSLPKLIGSQSVAVATDISGCLYKVVSKTYCRSLQIAVRKVAVKRIVVVNIITVSRTLFIMVDSF